MSKLFTIEMPSGKQVGLPKKINFDFNLKGAITTAEAWMIRAIAVILLVLIIYTIFSKVLSAQMISKQKEIENLMAEQQQQIDTATDNSKTLDTKTESYKKLIADLKRLNEKISDAAARRNSIPNLLNQIMSAIPNKVQLVQIENTEDRTVVINAQSYDYDQLGYFVAVLKTKNILKKVITSSTAKPDGLIYISIEGELP